MREWKCDYISQFPRSNKRGNMGYIIFISSNLLPDFVPGTIYRHLKYILKFYNLMVYLYANWPQNLPGKFPE